MHIQQNNNNKPNLLTETFVSKKYKVQDEQRKYRYLTLEERFAKLVFGKEYTFAIEMNISRRTFLRWIKGGLPQDNIETINQICNVLDVSIDFFITGDKDFRSDLTPAELHLISCYRNINPKMRKALRTVFKLHNT